MLPYGNDSKPLAEKMSVALSELESLPGVDRERTGFWFRGYGCGSVPKFSGLPYGTDFIALTIDRPNSKMVFPDSALSSLSGNIPVFIGLRNIPQGWKSRVDSGITGFDSSDLKLETVATEDSPKDKSEGWRELVDSLSGDFVSLISEWVGSI